MKPNRMLKWLAIAAVAAVAFGLLTVISGGRALFGGALSIRSLFWIVVAAFALRVAKTLSARSHAS